METENSTTSNTPSPGSQQAENKQALNQKTSLQFGVSVLVGLLTLFAIVAFGYYKLIRGV